MPERIDLQKMPIVKILIVEDEIIHAMALESGLGAAGLNMVLASSREQAMQCIESEKPDLAVIDVNLCSDMDGIETARKIKDSFGIPVIFMTGYIDHAVRQKADVVGYLGYFIKPVQVESILAIIDSCNAKEGI